MEWYLDYLAEQERQPLPFVGRFSTTTPVAQVVADIRAVLGVHDMAAGQEQYLRALVTAADAAGILVMRSGIVGSNTHRKLDVGSSRRLSLPILRMHPLRACLPCCMNWHISGSAVAGFPVQRHPVIGRRKPTRFVLPGQS